MPISCLLAASATFRAGLAMAQGTVLPFYSVEYFASTDKTDRITAYRVRQ
jgi:hypothetical protein